MTFRDLEENTKVLSEASNLYEELKTVGRTNEFNYVSSLDKVTSLRNDIVTSGSAGVDNANGEYNVFTTANGADSAQVSTKKRGRYSPGAVAEVGIGIRTNERPTGSQEWKAGAFTDSNGLYFGEDSEGYYVARIKGGTETKIRQANWNQDTLDGSGGNDNPSGAKLDLDKGNILRIDYAWYGYGEIKFKVIILNPDEENPKAQETVTVHSIYVENEPTTEEANLPVRQEVDNNGTAEAFDLYVGGRQFTILGTGKASSRDNGETRLGQSIDDTWTPLISFRKKAGDDNIPVSAEYMKVISDSTLEFELLVQEDGLTGANFVPPTHTSASETAVEVDTSATDITSFGERRFVSVVEGGNRSSVASTDAEIDFSVPEGDIVTLAARAPSGTATVDSVLNWREDF